MTCKYCRRKPSPIYLRASQPLREDLFIAFSQFEITKKYRPDEELVISGIREAGLLNPE